MIPLCRRLVIALVLGHTWLGAQSPIPAFIRWTYAQALAHRQPRYAEMARRWGITLQAGEVAQVRSEGDFIALVARVLREADRMRG